VKLPDSKIPTLRLRKLHYANVLAAKERFCQRNDKISSTSKELLECMAKDTPDEGKLAGELALVNLLDQGK
jgi:hypothetical protein